MIKAVIFDMDGLLIDSEPIWREAEVNIFATVGIQLELDDCRQTMGLRIDEAVKYWYDKFPWGNKSIDTVATEIVNRVEKLILEKGKALPGVYETLNFLKSKNLPMAVASSSAMQLINTVLNKLGIHHQFQVIQSAEGEPYGKPHPGVYINAAKSLGIDPEYCLAIEDSFNGILSAKAARMKTIAVPDIESQTDNRFVISDVILASLAEIDQTLLNRLNQ